MDVTVHLNGVASGVPEGTSVEDLVSRISPSPKGVAVARNLEVVPRSRWATTLVHEGDRVEILTGAQGG